MVFGLNRSGIEHTIYRTRGELANHYTKDAVDLKGEGTQSNTAKDCLAQIQDNVSEWGDMSICEQLFQ
jgi:hypothetical protein